jgi:succinyl-CoA synthetase beta subunit
MAKLHEYQGKALLKGAGIETPKGELASSPAEAFRAAKAIGPPVVVKAQAWTTSRAAKGAVRFADTAEGARQAAGDILGMTFKGFRVEQVLVEKRLEIEREFYLGIIIDDEEKAPVIVFSGTGGSGIEEMAAEHPDLLVRHKVSIRRGIRSHQARNLVRGVGIHGPLQAHLAVVITRLYGLFREIEARSAEINPLAMTSDGTLAAVDCRITIDDYAVFRHPDLGIEIAREFDRPPTPLEKIAYHVEEGDYRGTFYFIQLEESTGRDGDYIGFHGAGGGGSMMSMDALLSNGFRIANFCDTSGNPPASKVYRAARIILSQPGLDGYFASGSGVASQEQFHSARGLLKAFMEEGLSIPAVIRLGGNREEKAIEILEEGAKVLQVALEAYGKDTSAEECARRMKELVRERARKEAGPVPPGRTEPAVKPYRFDTPTGSIEIDHAACDHCESKACVDECVPSILELREGLPFLNIDPERARRGGCTECLACELECFFRGKRAVRIELPIEGLDRYRRSVAEGRVHMEGAHGGDE